MGIHDLHIHHLRNIEHIETTLIPDVNIIYGKNGSGKTSLLEAIYLLSSGYSFKTRETIPLVQYGKKDLTVFSRTFSSETISLRKMISGPTVVLLNSQQCTNNSVLAKTFPCQVFYQDIFNIIDSGPAVRRSLMDWGVFHVKHHYHEIWRNYRNLLKQRNALLRRKAQKKEFIPWDIQLIEHAKQLDLMREEYVKDWTQSFQHYLAKLCGMECQLQYFRGWSAKKSLDTLLDEQFEADCQRQYTQSGPHQADIRIENTQTTAKQGFSRGQQKIILIAMKLAQCTMLNRECIYLFDDITAELDDEHIQCLMSCLAALKGQKVITVLKPDEIQKKLQNIETKLIRLDTKTGSIANPYEAV